MGRLQEVGLVRRLRVDGGRNLGKCDSREHKSEYRNAGQPNQQFPWFHVPDLS